MCFGTNALESPVPSAYLKLDHQLQVSPRPLASRPAGGLKGSEAVFVLLPSAFGSVSELPGVHGRVRAAHPDGPGVPEGPVRDRSPAEQEVSVFKHLASIISISGPRVRTVGRSPGGSGGSALRF